MTFEPSAYTIKEIVKTIISNGKVVYDQPALRKTCDYCKREKATFWDEYKRIDNPHIYKVDLSDGLYELKTSMINEIRKG